MLNPSTADASADDPTVRRVMAFSRAWGHGGAEVVNLFAFRAVKPGVLRRVEDPVGPGNDEAILRAVGGKRVVAAWGALGGLFGRDVGVRALLSAGRVKLECLGFTDKGMPRHPLFVKVGVVPQAWGR